MVGDGVIVTAGIEVGWASSEFPPHPEIKITNKVNMTSLDEINGIKRPVVIHR